MRARRKHKEAYLTFSPYFFSFLRNFPLSKCTGFFCPQMTWKGFSGGNQVRICVIPYCRTIDSWGRSNRMWSSHIIAETGDEMEWFSFQPTSRFLEDVLTFLASFSSQLQPHMKSFYSWKPGSYLRAFVNAIFSAQNALPEPLPPFFRESSSDPPDEVSFLCSLSGYLFTYSIIICKFSEGWSIISPGPSILWVLNLKISTRYFSWINDSFTM